MKTFVIKNKEGKYWCGNDIFSATIDIRKTYICEDFDFINNVINKLSSEGLLKDCKVGEITIAEGNLEQQLAEKDKEIEELKAYKKGAYEKYISKCAYLQQQIKDTRKQVCDEVRKIIDYYSEWYEQGYVINVIEEVLLKKIDKIEQAKEE